MPSLRFLQISDLHLDSSLAASRLGLTPDKRAQRNRDITAALGRAVELAVSLEVEVVLCPGDLWDDESVSLAGATRLYDAFASLAPVPVVIAPGNHDPYHAFSYHHPLYFERKVGRPHPANVHVFGSPRLDTVRIASLPDVDFHGCCFEGNVPRTERLLAGWQVPRPEALNVMLLHGSRDDSTPAGADADRGMAAPFNRAELLATGADYTALGHYHRFSLIEDDAGRVRAAYGGAPVARGLDETGEGGVLVGEIDAGGVDASTLERVTVDPRRLIRLAVEMDRTVTNPAAAQERIEAALSAAKCRPVDIAYVELRGLTHPETPGFEFDPAWVEKLCFHAAIDQSALRPDHDLASLPEDRVDGAFARRMEELIAAEADPGRAATLRSALYLGLDALAGREVAPRHVD